MSDGEKRRLQYNPSQCYLEVARIVFGTLYGKEALSNLPESDREQRINNILFSLASITIIHSFLALESFVNAQLFWIWQRRNDGSPESKRFLACLGDKVSFEAYKTHKRISGLGERIKTLYHVLGLAAPHDTNPQLWQDFKRLVEDSRHFVVHPFPDPEFFTANMTRIMERTTWGSYVQTASGIIKDLYERSGSAVPSWLENNELMSCRGFEAIPP